MCIDLAAFYFIGIPIAVLVVFKFSLHAQVIQVQPYALFVLSCRQIQDLNLMKVFVSEKNMMQVLWIGLICGLACQKSGLSLLILLTRSWKKLEGSTNSNRESELSA